MAKSSNINLFDRAKRAGCWAIGLYAFALFFTLGMLASLLNGDIISTLGGFLLAALSLALGVWLARRSAGK